MFLRRLFAVHGFSPARLGPSLSGPALLRALPSQCTVCRAWPGDVLCAACETAFTDQLPRCARCAQHLPAYSASAALAKLQGSDRVSTTTWQTLCGACARNAHTGEQGLARLDACVAAVRYAYPWSSLLAQLKFRQETGLARRLAAVMRQAPGAAPLLADCDTLLPMPLSRQRLQERGFNQALLLARALAPAKTDAALLLRVRDTPPQTGLPRAQRLRNLDGAFAVDPLRASRVAGRKLLLLDDVMTTGTSLYQAALVLRQAGAAQVTALVLARTG